MDLQFSMAGWLHTLACLYALATGAVVIWRAKGGPRHRAAGRQYVYASALANLTALAIYKISSFTIFHALAITALCSLAIAFASAYWRAPRRNWLRVHLTAVLFSYYLLVGALINELFVRVPALQTQRVALMASHSATLLFFLMMVAYFWGRTAHHGQSSTIFSRQPTSPI